MTNVYHFRQIRDISKDVFLDTNFVISFAVKPPKSQKDEYTMHLNAKRLMTKLVSRKVNIYISLLILSEMWFVLTRNLYELVQGKGTWRYVEDKGTIFEQFSSDLVIYTRKLFNIPRLKLIPIKDHKRIAENALDNIKNYSLYPNDALHISTTQSENISCIVTNDRHFRQIHVPNLMIITF